MKNKEIIRLIGIFALIVCLLAACKDKNKPTVERFVPGAVSIGIIPNATLKSVFDSLNAFQLKIEAMHGFIYYAYLPADSLHSLRNYLNTKPYIRTGSWSAYAYFYEPDKAITISTSLFKMDSTYQSDFLQSVDSLSLIDRPVETKTMELTVPTGQEKHWVSELKKQSYVKWAELNRILPE